MHFEKRKYGSDCTLEEMEAIKIRTRILKPGILLYSELPVASEFTVSILKQRIFELVPEGKYYSLIVDVSNSSPPDGKVRFELKEALNEMRRKVHAVAIVSGKNLIINVVAQFVLSGFGSHAITMHKTIDEALQSLESRIKETVSKS